MGRLMERQTPPRVSGSLAVTVSEFIVVHIHSLSIGFLITSAETSTWMFDRVVREVIYLEYTVGLRERV